MAPELQLSSAGLAGYETPLLAIAMDENPGAATLTELDRAVGGALERAIASREFRGSRDETMQFTGGSAGPRRILLIGMGKTTDRPGALRRAAAVAARQATKLGSGDLAFHAGVLGEKEVEAVTVGLLAGAWEYKDLKTAPPEEERRAPLARATILADDTDATRRGFSAGLAFGAGHSLARTLAMMPGNICTPDFLAKTAGEIAERHSMKLNVLGRAEMTAEEWDHSSAWRRARHRIRSSSPSSTRVANLVRSR